MILKAQFKVDLTYLRIAKDPEGYLEHMKKSYASEFGRMICKNIPFVKNEELSFPRQGVQDRMYINPPEEIYECEVVAFSLENWQKFKNELKEYIEGTSALRVLDLIMIGKIFKGLENPVPLQSPSQKPLNDNSHMIENENLDRL
jgi:hypothetical protein